MVLDVQGCLRLEKRQQSQHVLESGSLLFSTVPSQHVLLSDPQGDKHQFKSEINLRALSGQRRGTVKLDLAFSS